MKSLVERIDTRNWPAEFLTKAVGEYESTHFCHAADPSLRRWAASGGTVSAILIHMLESGQADGAIVVSSIVRDGKLDCRFTIARSRDEVLAAQGSKYTAVYFQRDAVPLIRAFSGRLAVVLLPCDAKSLQRLRQEEPEVDSKIALVVTLFCGHNSEHALTEAIIRRHSRKHGPLRAYRYRFGHWRGSLSIEYADGTEVVRPFSDFSDYQNLFFFSQKKCHACFDHTGFFCDLAAGDIWSQRMKEDPIKKNALIVRSPGGARLISRLSAEGALQVEDVTIEDVCNGQSRAMPFHYNVSARSRVGSIFGMRLKDLTGTKVKWNHVLVAFMVMLNERITRGRIGRRIVLAIPKPMLRAYLFVLKGFESI